MLNFLVDSRESLKAAHTHTILCVWLIFYCKIYTPIDNRHIMLIIDRHICVVRELAATIFVGGSNE